MRLLVTGGCGFIGQHVVGAALERGHTVHVLDSLRADVHPHAPAPPEGAAFTEGDVRDVVVLDRLLPRTDAVIHLAAKVGLGVDVDDYPDYAASNDVGTATLLAAMSRHEVHRLTQASSMVVYGEGLAQCPEHGTMPVPPRVESDLAAGTFDPRCPRCERPLGSGLVPESTPPDPRNAYAVAKLAQEMYASVWARETGGGVVSLRYHNVYGPGMPEHTPYAGVASLFTAMIRRGEPPTVYEDGGQRRDFIHVRDIARATVRAAEHDMSGEHVAYNVGSGVPRTVLDLASALSRALTGPAPVVTGAYRLGDVRHITADSSAVRRALDWTPTEDFEAGVAELSEPDASHREPTPGGSPTPRPDSGS